MLATKPFQLGSSAEEGPSQTQWQKHPPPSPGRTGFRPTVYFLNFLFGVSPWPVRKRGEAVLRFASAREQEHLSPRAARLRDTKWSLCSKWGSRGEGRWGGGSRSEGVVPGDRRCLTHRERVRSSQVARASVPWGQRGS